MTDDPLQIFEPGFSGDGADKEARELIDAWRDEWHLEPELEMDNGNSRVYESLIEHVVTARNNAATRMRDRCVEKVRERLAEVIAKAEYAHYTELADLNPRRAALEEVKADLESLTLEGKQEKR